MAEGFGWSIYFMLGMMAVMISFVIVMVVKAGKTKPVSTNG